MTTTTESGPAPSSPLLALGPLLGNLPPDLLQQEVLRRLGPRTLASLAGAGRGCAEAVAATVLIQWAKRAKSAAPRYFAFLGFPVPPLCLKYACSYAADGGNREVLEWLHSTGCPWDAKTASVAACGGHLDVLQLARAHGCPWDHWTPTRAAEGGHLAVLQWARAHQCPWNWYVCIRAANAGQLEVLQWIRENDENGEVFAEDRVRRHAGGPRKQEVLTWLDGLSAP
jgi:hypothetical protein